MIITVTSREKSEPLVQKTILVLLRSTRECDKLHRTFCARFATQVLRNISSEETAEYKNHGW